MAKLIEWIMSNWLTVLALFIAIFGGIPGIIAIYEHWTDRPNVAMTISRIDTGSLKWPKDPQTYSYILLEFIVNNEEYKIIPLHHTPFSISIKIDNKWLAFDKMIIPLSGTVLYKDTNDIYSTNIDHMDLQKYKEFNIGRLYGNYKASTIKQDKYLNSKHYLLFQSSKVSDKKLEQAFSKINKEKLPIKITWKDLRGKQHEPFLVVQEPLIVTTGCYKVYGKIKLWES